MAREILIKQFDNFEQRLIVLENNDDPYKDIFEAVGEKWKRVRTIQSHIQWKENEDDVTSRSGEY